MAEAHEQTLAHLRLLAGLPGYWELRALHRDGGNRMTPRGSFWIVATATTDGLLYERLDKALAWADQHGLSYLAWTWNPWQDPSNVLIKDDPRVGAGDGPFRATQDEQASYVIESVALARAAGVQRYSIYKLQDQFPENGDEYWGLTRNDGSLRPAYVAYQVAVKYLQGVRAAVYSWAGSQVPPSAQEIATVLASHTNRFQWPWPAPVNTVVLDRPGQRVTVIWNTSPQPVQVALPATGRAAQLVDKYGQARPLVATNGAYPLTLEPSRNNSDPRDTTLYLVGGSPWIVVEDLTAALAPVPAIAAGSAGG